MAYTTIKKPSDYFNTKLYTGNDTTLAVSGVGFQPDWTWLKCRNYGGNASFEHVLTDAVRGVNKTLVSNDADAETTNNATGYLSVFGSDGFTVTGGDAVNGIGRTYASWNWLGANGTAANTDGSISSTVSANTTSGFSICTYTGAGSAATVGHGLGSTPKMIIIKRLNATADWVVGHQEADTSNPWNKYLQLNDPTVPLDRIVFNDTAPTNSVFSVGADILTNTNGGTYIAYCFAEKQGYSKFGSYTGNASADGTFVYTGFKPAFVIIKNIDAAESWSMFDGKRPDSNQTNGLYQLQPNTNSAEYQGAPLIDFVSNGFKLRTATDSLNVAQNYIYMCFAEQPLVGDNPATAR